MIAYIPPMRITRPSYHSSRNHRSDYWLDDSDHKQTDNISMTEPKGTRSSRVDRESRDKRSPEKYQRKFKIGDIVEYPKVSLLDKKIATGTIVEFCKNNFKKYIVRDSKTYVVYTVHEKDLKLVPPTVNKEDISTIVKNAAEDAINDAIDKSIITAEDLQRCAQLAADTDGAISISKVDCCSLKEEISSDKVVNNVTGHTITEDIDGADFRLKMLECSIKKLKRERLQQYYTNIGLMCALL